jgi:hypothetical protein
MPPPDTADAPSPDDDAASAIAFGDPHYVADFDPRLTLNPYRGVKRVLVFASGARPEILSQCRTDEATYVGLGGTVIATSALASVSMWFALHSALKIDPLTSALGAILWAAVIFNLDRWLIVSQKRLTPIWKNWLAVIPRVIVAFLLGFVISEPLVHQLFRPELDRKIAVINQEDLNTAIRIARHGQDARQIAKDKKEIKTLRAGGPGETAQITSLRQEVEQLQKEINDAQTALNDANADLLAEINGIAQSGKSGCGAICQQKTLIRDQKRAAFDQAHSKNDDAIARKNREIEDIRSEYREEQRTQARDDAARIKRLEADIKVRTERINDNVAKIVNASKNGMLADIRALSSLGNENPSVNIAHYLIFFLFIALDTIPVIGKTLILSGRPRAYELACDAVDSRLSEEAQQVVDEARGNRTARQLMLATDTEIREEAQRSNAEHFIRQAADTQREIGDLLLSRWREEQLARVHRELEERGASGTR